MQGWGDNRFSGQRIMFQLTPNTLCLNILWLPKPKASVFKACFSDLHHQWIVFLGASDTWQHLEFGRPFLPGWRTDAGRQWCQRVYFRSRLPNDRLVPERVGRVLHLIGYAGRSPSNDPFCHFVVFQGDIKMLVSSWWCNYVLWTKHGSKFWPSNIIA